MQGCGFCFCVERPGLTRTRSPPETVMEFRENIAASVPYPRVWWLGPKRSAAHDDGATGGMNAGILLAHIIAAARVRRQSLQIHKEIR